MPADTTSSKAPATRSHGCRQSPSLIFRCLPTGLLRNRNTSGPRQLQYDIASGRGGGPPDPIMAAQRPSFPACPWSLLSDITERCPTIADVPEPQVGLMFADPELAMLEWLECGLGGV